MTAPTAWPTAAAVARFQLLQWPLYVALPWVVLAFSFAVNLVVASQTPAAETGGLASLYVWVLIGGLLSTYRSFPFGLALGASRRAYYLGTAGFAVAMAAVYALVLTVLQAIERASDGWGTGLEFFRVPYLLDGAWYLTWLTSFVGLALLFVYGMWYGIVYRRWGVIGMSAFVASQILVLLAVVLVVTWTETWSRVGDFFSALSAAGLTGVLAAVTLAMLVGGLSTIRRATA